MSKIAMVSLASYLAGWIVRGLTITQTWVFTGLLLAACLVLHVLRKRMERKLKTMRAQPKQTGTFTVQQMLLMEQINDHNNPRRSSAVVELWESIYGQPVDGSRPLMEIVEEVSVALAEKSS